MLLMIMKKELPSPPVSLLLLGLFAVAVSGCNLDPNCQDPNLCDNYYAKRDSKFSAALERKAQTTAQAEQRQEMLSTPAPQALDIREMIATQEEEENAVRCATVVPGGSISQAVQDANKGIFPPLEWNGQPLQVSFPDGTIKTLEEALNDKNFVYPDQTICISKDFHRIKEQAPTPQSRLPSPKEIKRRFVKNFTPIRPHFS